MDGKESGVSGEEVRKSEKSESLRELCKILKACRVLAGQKEVRKSEKSESPKEKPARCGLGKRPRQPGDYWRSVNESEKSKSLADYWPVRKKAPFATGFFSDFPDFRDFRIYL
jgi:hypothetical protein